MALGLNKNQVQKIKELKDTLEKEDRTDLAVIAKIAGIVKDLGLNSDINKPLDGDPALVTASTSKKHGGTTLAHYAASENYAIILDYLNETYGPASSASPKLDLTLERREQYGKSGKKKVKKKPPLYWP